MCFFAVDSARLCQMPRAHRVMTTGHDALRVQAIRVLPGLVAGLSLSMVRRRRPAR